MTISLSNNRNLILGSTSAYRRDLLARLHIPFEVAAPDVDETPLPGEAPHALAERLALAKARVVAIRFPHAVVIGSDQVADLNGQSLGKPGTHDKAVAQLRQMRGQTVVFHPAVGFRLHRDQPLRTGCVAEPTGLACMRKLIPKSGCGCWKGR